MWAPCGKPLRRQLSRSTSHQRSAREVLTSHGLINTSKNSWEGRKGFTNKPAKTGNWSNYRFFQKECRREMRKAEYQYVNRVIEEGMKGNNIRPFWRYVKARRQDNTGVAPLKKGTALFSDSITKAKILLDQFRSVFTKDDGAQLPKNKSQD